MPWQDDLVIVVARTKNKRYEVLTADDHPDHEIWRARMTEKATGVRVPVPVPVHMPTIRVQAGNALAAAGRFVGAWWKGDQTTVDTAEAARRLAICFQCDKYDNKSNRCSLCGCFSKYKNRLATEHCPLPESEGGPKW
jgi:hypothetical protein